jgi:hypothetical protein
MQHISILGRPSQTRVFNHESSHYVIISNLSQNI